MATTAAVAYLKDKLGIRLEKSNGFVYTYTSGISSTKQECPYYPKQTTK